MRACTHIFPRFLKKTGAEKSGVENPAQNPASARRLPTYTHCLDIRPTCIFDCIIMCLQPLSIPDCVTPYPPPPSSSYPPLVHMC